MKSRPEIDKTPTAPTVEALNVKTPTLTEGINMSNSTVVPANSQPVFNFGDNQVRVVVLNGDPWFVAADLWAALKLTNPSKAMKVLAPGERSNFKLGRQGEVNIVSEAGLYTLVLRCRDAVKPGTVAYQFRTWVTGEVLPAIRKTGQYQQQVAQTDPTIDYTRITPAQAQDLREIVQSIVDAKIQGYGETWARLQRKFRVNSYLQLPVSRYEEARAYLISKLPQGYAGELFEEESKVQSVDLALVESAMTAANTVAAQVQKEAFMAMVKHQQLGRCRFQLSIGYGSTGAPQVKPIEESACVATIPQMAMMIETPGAIQVESQDLMNLAKACMNRLATRLEVRSLAA